MQEPSQFLSGQASQELKRYEVYISPKKILQFITYLIILLATISFFLKLGDILKIDYPYKVALVKMFYLDEEKNIPALFSVIVLLLDSFVLATIAHLNKVVSRRFVAHWLGLSVIFFLLAVDEGLSFHELLVFPLHAALHVHGGLLTFTWVVGGAMFVLVFLLSYLKFTFKLPTKTRRLFAIAFALYVGAAMGLEMIGGELADLFGFESLPYLIETTLEESLEMLGAAVFLYALLSYLRTQLVDREVHLCLHKK